MYDCQACTLDTGTRIIFYVPSTGTIIVHIIRNIKLVCIRSRHLVRNLRTSRTYNKYAGPANMFPYSFQVVFPQNVGIEEFRLNVVPGTARVL